MQRIFREITEGRGLVEVAKALNREGILSPRGNSRGKTTIEAYIGTLVWGRSSVRNLPPIRSEEAWSAIVSRDSNGTVSQTNHARA